MDGLAPTALVPTPFRAAPWPGLRLRLGTILWLIAVSAPLVAFYARIGQPDVALPVSIVLVLTGLAVGAARRAPAWKVAAQLGLTGCVGLAVLEIDALLPGSETKYLYVIIALFAATVVAPLLVRNGLDAIGERWRGPIKNAADVSWNVGLNLAALVVFIYVAESIVPSFGVATTITTGPALPGTTLTGPITLYNGNVPTLYVPVAPAPVSAAAPAQAPPDDDDPRGCEETGPSTETGPAPAMGIR